MNAPTRTPVVTPAVPLVLDEDDCVRRINLATAQDTCKGMFFNGVVQSVTRAGPDALAAWKRRAGKATWVDFFNYPITQFLPLAFHAAELVAPHQLDVGFRELGRQATRDFLATTVGKTLLMLTGNDPRRLMNSLASCYKTAVSYGQRTVNWQGTTRCVFAVRRDFMPHPYHEGVLLEAVETVGAKHVTAAGQRLDMLDIDYHLTWS